MVRASVLASSVVGSNPTRAALFSLLFSSEKKELFGLVAFPFFLFIEKSFHVGIFIQAITKSATNCVYEYMLEGRWKDCVCVCVCCANACGCIYVIKSRK